MTLEQARYWVRLLGPTWEVTVKRTAAKDTYGFRKKLAVLEIS